MTIFPALRRSLPAWGLLALAGCTSAASNPYTPPPLPPNYRSTAAFYLMQEYIEDATGPAEIERFPSEDYAFLRASNVIKVRYPIIRKGNFFKGPTPGMRCVNIMSQRDSTHKDKLVVGRLAEDPTECKPDGNFEPFVELQQMADRSRACKRDNTYPCYISGDLTLMPRR